MSFEKCHGEENSVSFFMAGSGSAIDRITAVPLFTPALCLRANVNPSSDLLKYVRYFSAVKDYLVPEEDARFPVHPMQLLPGGLPLGRQTAANCRQCFFKIGMHRPLAP